MDCFIWSGLSVLSLFRHFLHESITWFLPQRTNSSFHLRIFSKVEIKHLKIIIHFSQLALWALKKHCVETLKNDNYIHRLFSCAWNRKGAANKAIVFLKLYSSTRGASPFSNTIITTTHTNRWRVGYVCSHKTLVHQKATTELAETHSATCDHRTVQHCVPWFNSTCSCGVEYITGNSNISRLLQSSQGSV